MRRRDPLVLLLLASLAGLIFLAGLGAPGLFDADEPAYAQAAREMGQRGDWVTPTFNGQPRFDKPVLFYWLILLSYRLLGVTEFAVRCWSALAGVGLTLLLALAARRWLGRPADLWAGLAFCTSPLCALLGRAAVTDMLLCLAVTSAILAGLAALEASGSGRGWALLAWAAMGLAVLVKGPVGLLIPALALGPTLWLLRDVRRGLRRLVPWEGPILFLLLVGPWYALVLQANGWAFVEGFILKHHVTRYTGVVSSHAGPVWYYLPVLLVGAFPWSAYLPAALWPAWRAARGRRADRAGDRLRLACGCWLVAVFIFFSLAGTKLPSYLLPAFPALALLVGGAIRNGRRDAGELSTDRAGAPGVEPPRWAIRLTPWLIGMIGFALAIGFGSIPWIVPLARPAARGVLDGVPPPTVLATALALLVAAGVAAALRAGEAWRPRLLAATMACLLLAAGLVVAPRADGILQAALRDFAETAGRSLAPDDVLVVYGLNAPSIVFYANRPVVPVGSGSPESAALLARLTASGRRVLVITRHNLAAEVARIPGLVLREARGGYALLDSGPR